MASISTGRTVAVIDLAKLRRNVREIRAKIPEEALFCAVVKADAYGHGADRMIPVLRECGVDRYAVAFLREGQNLRNAGVTEPIHILGDTCPEDMQGVIEAGLIPAVFDVEMARDFSEAAARAGTVLPIDIAIDTGMGRIGFQTADEAMREQAAEQIESISQMPNLKIEGLFSHFAKADETDKTFTAVQTERFAGMREKLAERGIRPQICHIANSAAILELPETCQQMMRAGIILYGLMPSDEVSANGARLEPVLSWISHVSYVKEVPAGTPIGYGGTYVTDRTSRIATIPVGYADGYRRDLSNTGAVEIAGRLAPIRGRVCMDQFMVDVTDIPDVKRGDPVRLIGDLMTADRMAELAHTISYEIVCGISIRVPRVYTNGDSSAQC
ncbi:MAG: alanine racemase [Firmicutes bacterium]|nr:alanine racemase [Bacillota bacterium]